jgi:hypothetical protein
MAQQKVNTNGFDGFLWTILDGISDNIEVVIG